MKRSTLIAIVIVVLAVAGAVLWNMGANGPLSFGKKSTTAANTDHTPAAPDMAVGESCNAMCGTTPIAITCAVGETPACDCNATPRVQCVRNAK